MGIWLIGSSWSEIQGFCALHSAQISRANNTFVSCCYSKEMKGWDFTLHMCQKNQIWEASVAGSQVCDLNSKLLSPNFPVFPAGCSFTGAPLGWDAGWEVSHRNFPVTALPIQHVRVRLRLSVVFARLFHLFIETSGQKSSQPEKWEIKPGSHEAEWPNPSWFHCVLVWLKVS